MTEGESQRVGRIGRGLHSKTQGVAHDIGNLPLFRAAMTHDRCLHARRLNLHNLTSPTAERHEQGAARLRKSESGLREAARERCLDDHHIRNHANEQLLELFGECSQCRRTREAPPWEQSAELDGGGGSGVAIEEAPPRHARSGVQAEYPRQFS